MAVKAYSRLLIFLVVVACLGTLIFFIQRYQISRMNQSVQGRAAEAEKSGDFETAARLYQEHLEINPEDQDVKKKLADVLVKGPKSPAHQDQAIVLYSQLLTREPGLKDIRRRLAELLMERQRFDEAREHLATLVSAEKSKEKGTQDGELWFMLGRCFDALNEPVPCCDAFKQAIENHFAGAHLEAFQRRAFLLRGSLDQPEEARQIMEDMIKEQPDNPDSYLARGRYRLQFGKTEDDRKDAKEDFQRVRDKAPNTPEVYLELARLELTRQPAGLDQARGYLEQGLKQLPKDPSLHEARAMLELQQGASEKAASLLRESVELLPDQPMLRWRLAKLQAERGETAGVLSQIEELKRLKFSNPLTELLEAYLQIDSKEWAKARQTLLKLEPIFKSVPELNATIQVLLARCYQELGDSDRKLAAFELAAKANPGSYQALAGLAESLAAQGELDRAIEEYQKLNSVPQARPALMRLLIVRNQQRPLEERDWSVAEKLVDVAAKSDPKSSEWVVLKADLRLAQGKVAEARDLLEKGQARDPDAIGVRIKLAELLRKQRQFAEAGRTLEDAENLVLQDLQSSRERANRATGEEAKTLRSRAEVNAYRLTGVRIEKARLLIAEGRGDAAMRIEKLVGDVASLPKTYAVALVDALAVEAAALNDLSLTRALWSKAAELEPKKLDPRIRLLEIAFQSREKDQEQQVQKTIEEQLNRIQEIDGADGLMSQYLQCRYLMWQANQDINARDPVKQDQLRTTARNQLNELLTRRADWSVIPMALGQLAEPELAPVEKKFGELKNQRKTSPDVDQALFDATKVELNKKRQEVVSHYQKAIDLGQRSPAVLQRALGLYKDLGSEFQDRHDQVFRLLPANMRNSLYQNAARIAFNEGRHGEAIESAQKGLQDSPKSTQARFFLVDLLIADGKRGEAEKTLREGDPSNPDIQQVLVRLLILMGRKDKAEQALGAAEATLKTLMPSGPLALAHCCESIGQSYKDDETRLTEWNNKATTWYGKAENGKPDDFEVTRQFVDFLLRINQRDQARNYLTKILDSKDSNQRTPEQMAWARRSLAFVLILGNEEDQLRQAQELMKPIEEKLAARKSDPKIIPKPEDLRILAKVYEARRTKESHLLARGVMEELVESGLGNAEDRLLLALTYQADGDWDKAWAQFDGLISDTDHARDLDIQARRPEYLTRYILALLSRHEHDPQPEFLTRAEALVDKLAELQPDALGSPALKARILKAQKQPEKARELIEAYTRNPRLRDEVRLAWAKQAEDLSFADLAKRLLTETLQRTPDGPANRQALARFLARQGQVQEALVVLEPAWKPAVNPEQFINSAIAVLYSATGKPDASQIERVAGWIESALARNPGSSPLITSLANLRERQGKFREAEDLYRKAIDQKADNVIALNNLAWLMVLQNESSADALNLINRAVNYYPSNPELLDTRGMIYMSSGDHKRAINDLNQAIDRDPTAIKYFHLAQAYLRASNRENAAQALAKANDKGLAATDLHPLELTAYQKVLSDLKAPR
jgi:tetratricopeptide (TPR) repeat protein